ncbi:MAG TPA: class I SAM-dependent methyltransferase [Bacteroidota bacterium]|nr:class I SAM-dependent methyltransferase [Bacteroidota bacterium]
MTCPVCASEENVFVESWLDTEIGQEYLLFRCPRCTLVYASPMRASGASHYELGETYKDRWEFHRTLELLGSEKKTILEIGCGEGLFLKYALQRGHECVGLDFNRRAVEKARATLNSERIYAWTLDEFAVRFPNERFDAVCLYHVLEHVERPLAFILQIKVLLRERGMICFAVPNPQRFSLQHGPREPWDYPSHHLTRWTQKSVQTLLDHAGLELVAVENQPLRIGDLLEMLMGKTSLGIMRKMAMRSGSGTAFQPRKQGQPSTQQTSTLSMESTYWRILVHGKRLLLLPVAALLYLWDRARGLTGESFLVVARVQVREQ